MGCCHAGDSKDKGEILLLHTDPEKQHELQETIKEISSQQPVSRAELNSKIESSSVNNNLPNSKKLAASYSSKNDHPNNNNNFSNNAQTGLDKGGLGLANKESSASLVKDRVETQTDAKHHEEKIGTQVSQDINHDDNYDNDDEDSEQEDVVNDIIDNLIKQNINSMNN